MALKYNPQQRKQAGGGPNDPNIPIEPKGIQQPLLMPTDDLKNSTFTNRPVYNGLTGGLSMEPSVPKVQRLAWMTPNERALRRNGAPMRLPGSPGNTPNGSRASMRGAGQSPDEEGGGNAGANMGGVQTTMPDTKQGQQDRLRGLIPKDWNGRMLPDSMAQNSDLPFSLYFSPSFRPVGANFSGFPTLADIYPFLSPGGGLAGSNPVGVNVYGYNDDGYRKWYRSGGSGISYRGSPSPWYQTLINWRI
jgi:hypothetical protein